MFTVGVGASGEIYFRAARIVAHGERCEPLQGCDFVVQAALEGELGPTDRVMDFYTADAALRQVCTRLHRRIMVPLRNPDIEVAINDGSVGVSHLMRRWSLPEIDTVLLDVVNPTQEALALIVLEALCTALANDVEAPYLRRITVTVSDREGSGTIMREWSPVSTVAPALQS